MKNKGYRQYIFLFVFGAIFLYTCKSPQTEPLPPNITFKNILLADSFDALGNKVKLCRLCFNVIDANGDIGLAENDTTGAYHKDSLYHYDLFTKLFEVKNGEPIEIDEPAPRNFRIPYIVPAGQNKLLMADIYIDMDFTFNQQQQLMYDSVMFEFYIVDRALHKSNTEHSIEINLYDNGVFPPDTLDQN